MLNLPGGRPKTSGTMPLRNGHLTVGIIIMPKNSVSSGVWTNDRKGKYFSWDYVICAALSEKMPAIIHEALSKNFIAPERKDCYHEHCTYWKEAALRKALLTFLPYPEWSTEDLAYVADKDLNRCMQKLDSYLRFYRVQYLG